MRKFLFSRIHYTGLFGGNWSEKIFSDLQEIENSEGFVFANGYEWSFSGIQKQEIENNDYIIGKLIKINPEEERITIDEQTKEEKPYTTENVKEKESFFMIDINAHFISFEISKILTKKQFTEAFFKAFEKAEKPYEIEFDFTYDEEILVERLKKLKKANSAHFKLKTTNPHAYEEFKEIDELFQKSGIDASNLHFQPKKGETLNITDQQSIIRQAISMSSAGYGGGTVYGEDISGKPFTVQTGENIIDKIEVSESKKDDEIKKTIIIKFNKKKK
ncbi:hypothetical protein JW758_00410 [Candidatus Peregrinibacteria bacterium]|nr:hypothetical protein [Candidatus Peregrinibacteria bacterium]